jgi:hypothetical protein
MRVYCLFICLPAEDLGGMPVCRNAYMHSDTRRERIHGHVVLVSQQALTHSLALLYY